MILTKENYFSQEASKKYMSASQLKSFLDCESKAIAEIEGKYVREKTTALLVGSYVDSYFSKSLDLFKAKNSEIFTAKGELKSDFKHANYIIERLEREPMMMKYLNGQAQVIKTGEIGGVPFKIAMDSYHPNKAIVDLKVVKDFSRIWQDGVKLTFVEYWKYDLQMAIYQCVEGGNLPVFLTAITKEKEPDLAIISIPQERLDYCLQFVKDSVNRFDNIKKGQTEPTRCEKCDYCKSTKTIKSIISYEEVGE